MRKQVIYFLLMPDTLLMDLAGPADAFLFANRHQKNIHFELRFIGATSQINSSIGLQLGPLLALPDKLEGDATLVIPGMVGMQFDYQEPNIATSISWMRTHIKQQRVVCICAGALPAAQAGLLKGRQATTHHAHCQDLATIDSSIQIEENRIFVQDGNVFTSAGVTAGIDLALHLISDLVSPQTAIAVARAMVVYLRRSGNDPQLSPWLKYRNHLHPVVHRVQDIILKNPAHPWNLDDLAAQAFTSTRHLTRLFKQHAEVSVQDYLTSLRLSLADQMLSQTTWSIERVAEAAGFGSVRQFRRVWQHTYQSPPSQHKRH
jgi:transcriptional regulator GlxA family with amidase domain